MPSSGSVDFTVNRDQIVTDAFTEIGYLANGQPLSPEDLAWGVRKLNYLVKQWQGKADFAPGLKVFARKTAYLFLQKDQGAYSLGPSGDHWTSSYGSTTIRAAEAANQTVLDITSSSGMTNGAYIGILLDTGAIHWSTISTTGAGPTVTIAAGISAAAAAGNRVFFYTTKARRPLEILTGVLRDTDTRDTQMLPMSLQRYESLPDKTADGDPRYYLYEAMLTNGSMKLDVEPSDVTKVGRFVFLGAPEDFDAANDTPDYPQEWFKPLMLQLAIDLCPGCSVVASQDLKNAAALALAIAQGTNPETSEVIFEPDRD